MDDQPEAKSKKKLPDFASDQEESDFWDTHDSTDYLDGTTTVDEVFVDARPNVELRLEADDFAKLKEVARRKGVGYQTLIRMWVMERLGQES
jgi:predicted DNA binding CopG/RHH family protein